MNTKLSEREELLLALLRSGLWNCAHPEIDGFDDWEYIAALAKRQSVLGIVAKSIISDKMIQTQIPNSLRIKLKSFVVSCVMTYENMTAAIRKVCVSMTQAGLIPVFLKGHSLAANYPHPELRQCGDIDVYVGVEGAAKAYEALRTVASAIDPEDKARWGKHFSAHLGDIEVEVHRHTSTQAAGKYSRIYEAVAHVGLTKELQQMNLEGVVIFSPSVVFNAYYIFDHLFEHFLKSGIGLRHLCDLMLYLHKYSDRIDRDALGTILRDMDMLEPWQAFGTVLVQHLGMPKEEFPFYQDSSKADKVLRYIWKDGNFGKDTAYYKRRNGNYLQTKFSAFLHHVTRGLRMMAIFPRHEMRHFRYVISNYFIHLAGEIRRKRHGR